MKKVLVVLMMLVTSLTFAQEEKDSAVKDQFIETLKPYVEKVLNGIEQGVELASEEIPEIIMQYVIYSSVTSWLWVIGGLLFIFCNRRIRRAIVKLPNKLPTDEVLEKIQDTYGDDGQITYGISKVVLYVAGIIMFFTNIGTAIKATFLPKLFLVEKFIELI